MVPAGRRPPTPLLNRQLQPTTTRARLPPMEARNPLPIVTETADPSLERDARALYGALSDLIRVYQFRDRDRICCYDVSVSQCYALETLVRQGGMTLNDLAAHLYLDKSTASREGDSLAEERALLADFDPEIRRAMANLIARLARAAAERVETGGGSCCRVS